MSDEEKVGYADLIKKEVSKQSKTTHFIQGGTGIALIAIFLSIALPMYDKIYSQSKDISNVQMQINECVKSSEAYENFLPKGMYHRLQKDEHESDLEAIRNPENADLIYMKNNSKEAENLGIVSRSATPYKKAYDKIKNETN